MTYLSLYFYGVAFSLVALAIWLNHYKKDIKTQMASIFLVVDEDILNQMYFKRYILSVLVFSLLSWINVFIISYYEIKKNKTGSLF